MVKYNADDVKIPSFPKRKVTAWIKIIAEKYEKRVGEVSFIFCSDTKIIDINRNFLNHDYYTDIITFDYSENDRISGELYISVDTVRTNAQKYKQPYQKELFRVMIHGILHLCGINDITHNQKKMMRNNENEALKHIIQGDGEIDISFERAYAIRPYGKWGNRRM